MNHERDLLQELTGRTDPGTVPYAPDPERILQMVHQKTVSEKERTVSMSKSKSWKSVLLAAVLIMAIGVCAYAANGRAVSVFGSGPSISDPTYRTLPTEQQCQKDAGFVPVLKEKFANGYTFMQGSLVSNQFLDEENLPVEEYKSFHFLYGKDGDTVYYEEEKYQTETSENSPPQETRDIDGVTLSYYSGRHKFVPEGYVPTEEEQKAVETGELSFGYGDADMEISERETQILLWQDGVIHYSLFQMNGKLSADELFAMAEELLTEK